MLFTTKMFFTEAENHIFLRLFAKLSEQGPSTSRVFRVGQYIVDFVCFERKLIIELEGGQHALPDEILEDRHPPFFRDVVP